MSDEASTANDVGPESDPALAVASPSLMAPTHGGALLRQAREAAGLHVAALAVSLKVPVRQLEALEAGRFEQLPDPIFIRALASSICRQLRIDTKPILAALPQAPALAPRVGEGINAPFQRPGMASGPGLAQLTVKPPIIIAVVLALAALALLLQPGWLPLADRSKAAPAASGAQDAPAAAPEVLPPASAAASGPGGQGGMSGVVVEQVQPAVPLPGSASGAGLPANSNPSPGRMP